MSPVFRRLLATAAGIVFVILAAQAGDEADVDVLARIDRTEAAWTALDIDGYQLSLQHGSAWRTQIIEVWVQGGLVVRIAVECGQGWAGGPCEIPRFVPRDYTVPGLFRQAREAAQAYLDSAGASDPTRQFPLDFDPIYHFPARIWFDDARMVDEEWEITVGSFRRISRDDLSLVATPIVPFAPTGTPPPTLTDPPDADAQILWTSACDPRTDLLKCVIGPADLDGFYATLLDLDATLTYGVPADAGDLAPYDLILADYCGRGVDPRALTALLADYIAAGGSVVAMGDNFCAMSAERATELTRPFGITFTSVDHAIDRWSTSIADHPVTQDVGRVYVFRPASLDAAPPAQMLVTMDAGGFIAVYDGEQDGTVIAIAVTNLHWTWRQANESDNLRLWRNMLTWLIEQARRKRGP